MKNFTYVILSIVIFMGCIGQGPDYPTEDFIIKEHDHDPSAGEVIKSVDDNNDFGDNQKEVELDEKFTKLGDYSGCVAKTNFPDGVYTEAGEEDVDRVMSFYEEYPELGSKLLGRCITDENVYIIYKSIWKEDRSTAISLAEQGYVPDDIFIRALESDLGPYIAYKLSELNAPESVTESVITSLKNFDEFTQSKIVGQWLGKKISEDEYKTLENIHNFSDVQIFGAWVRGQEPDESPDEFREILKGVKGDTTIYKNFIKDVKNPLSRVDLVGNSIIVDETGNGFNVGHDRKYIDQWINIPGIDIISTLKNGKAYEVTKTPYWRPKLLTDERNKLRKYYFDDENGNGHMIKLRVYDKEGNPTNKWLWLGIRLEGINNLDGTDAIYIEINKDGDETPEYIYTNYPAEVRQDKPWPFPELSSQGFSFYPDLEIANRVYITSPELHISGFGDIINEGWTWCRVGDQKVTGYDECHKDSRGFRNLAETYWTLFYSPYGINDSGEPYPNYPLYLWNTMK